MSYLTLTELAHLGFKKIGSNVKISRFTNIYNPENMEIGNNVRIDDFCILSAGEKEFKIGNYVHIAAGVYIFGAGGFIMDTFTNISSGCKIYTATDDYSGNYHMGPTIPNKFRNVIMSPIILDKHTIIGTNTVILPGVHFYEGVAVGATHSCSFVY
jgi:acetyltransferase-like isoleucine patch superfamily enzyme